MRANAFCGMYVSLLCGAQFLSGGIEVTSILPHRGSAMLALRVRADHCWQTKWLGKGLTCTFGVGNTHDSILYPALLEILDPKSRQCHLLLLLSGVSQH